MSSEWKPVLGGRGRQRVIPLEGKHTCNHRWRTHTVEREPIDHIVVSDEHVCQLPKGHFAEPCTCSCGAVRDG